MPSHSSWQTLQAYGRTGVAMTALGITGHQGLPINVVAHVVAGIRSEIVAVGVGLEGVCSLAEGSDQLFAMEVLAASGTLTAIIPSLRYEKTFSDEDQRANYENLLKQVSRVEACNFQEPSEEAFYAAGKRVVDLCDQLIAVWDGLPSRGLGGTADIVAYARMQQRPMVVIWPTGVSR